MDTTINRINDCVFDDDEIFDDSTLLANLERSGFMSNNNDINEKSLLNVSALCCDEELSGYDKLTGKTWIYPTNYPVRDYQFNIIQAAILKNTLVSLPTGLGKTFIAAVIMYNFYRWYPLGKIVFTAPTRPLVAQQIEACYNIVALPPKDTIEMTGHMQVSTRKVHWQTKRVFFATPQVIYNDIKSGICPSDRLRCLVIDEAHRARGNYAYCQIVSTLSEMGHKTYRLLALSATPGSKVDDVVNVVKNLNIAHLELRTEICIDVAPYSHSRKINTVVIKLGPELSQLRQQYVEILDGYARRLKQLNILPYNLGNLSKGRVVMLYKEYQTKDRGARHPQHNMIMRDFMLLIALYHGLELLIKHGSRVFLNFFDEHPEKTWIQSDDALTALLERLRDDLGINPLSLNRSILPDGSIPEIPKSISFGHPKFDKLKEIMLNHFNRAKQNGQETKAIVFCEYRESVNLVHCLLLQCRPLIVPQMFVGQGASGKEGKAVVSQKQQLRVMRNFRAGACNALVCTCVAEEGLDIGSVELIVCFDISTSSPVRLVQRCGRTGRERDGQVFILVTEGREHQTLMDCMRQRDGLNKKILHSQEVNNNLYKGNPRMIPREFMPQCRKMHITVKTVDGNEKKQEKAKKGQKDLRSMLGRKSSSSSSISLKDFEIGDFISETEFNDIYPNGFRDTNRRSDPIEYWKMNKAQVENVSKEECGFGMSTWLEWQRTSQKTINVGHSVDTDIMTSLLQYSDAKRFNAPASTQNPTFNTQDLAAQDVQKQSPIKSKQTRKRQRLPLIKSPGKKDGDIRALFSTATKSTKNYTKLLNDLGIQNDGKIPTNIINLLVDLNFESTNFTRQCLICATICDCQLLKNIQKKHEHKTSVVNGKTLKLPDLNLIDDISIESILNVGKVKSPEYNSFINDVEIKSPVFQCKLNQSSNFDLEFDFEESDESSKAITESITKIESNTVENNFDIGDIEDIFANSSPEQNLEKETVVKKSEDPKETLGFFGLNSIDDIFADSVDNINVKVNNVPDIPKIDNKDLTADRKRSQLLNEQSQANVVNKNPPIIKSPSILSGNIRLDTEVPTSPILSSQPRKFVLSTKKKSMQCSTPVSCVKRKLSMEPEVLQLINKSEDISNKCIETKTNISNNRSMFTITQLVEMINKSNNDSNIKNDMIVNNEAEAVERCGSPVILTQAEKKFRSSSCHIDNNNSQYRKHDSLIILDSDSDDNTQPYNAHISEQINELSELNNVKSLSPNYKRKLEDDDKIAASPYFPKRQKLEESNKKSLTLQEKVLAALSSNKFNEPFEKNKRDTNCMFFSQKENKNPLNCVYKKNNSDDESKSRLEVLQAFRRDSKPNTKSKNKSFNKNNSLLINKSFDDSDDDFVTSQHNFRSGICTNGAVRSKRKTNHKVRKKTKASEFLDLEAELSSSASGDELSDTSAGSLVEFICDDDNDVTVDNHVDMRAHYMQSVKSPMKGMFKIPELPKKFDKAEVFSQFVEEEDAYEMFLCGLAHRADPSPRNVRS
ncbi:Fanconi anemia group M protein isoform X2 [Leptidea sinapis]|uniref:Fanconi anemia group M protein isoform X2 n=1 Tax=Leptidea sinapis TaxID=189913 RepID=UPI0021C3867E|nr:Fanconi anemia group M protein isoform X2 [Leptidea sinapis]